MTPRFSALQAEPLEDQLASLASGALSPPPPLSMADFWADAFSCEAVSWPVFYGAVVQAVGLGAMLELNSTVRERIVAEGGSAFGE